MSAREDHKIDKLEPKLNKVAGGGGKKPSPTTLAKFVQAPPPPPAPTFWQRITPFLKSRCYRMRVRETKVSVTGDNFEIRLRRAKLFGTLRCEDWVRTNSHYYESALTPPWNLYEPIPKFQKANHEATGE